MVSPINYVFHSDEVSEGFLSIENGSRWEVEGVGDVGTLPDE